MIIPDELAKKIVDTAMCVVHRNVNIMNRDGIIIATGHPHRHRTYHKGANDAIETGTVIEIYPDELSLYPGALQGVNLPIMLDDQVVGVVGIFGHPDEVRDTGRLVKMITELILERELLQQETHSQHRLREQFVEMLLWHDGNTISPKLKRSAKTLGINLQLPRAVAIFDSLSLIDQVILEYGDSELVQDRAADMILNKISANHLLSDQDIAVILDKRLIVLKTVQSHESDHSLRIWAEQLVVVLAEAESQPISSGLGAIIHCVSEYPASFQQAEYCLANCTPKNSVLSIYDRNLLVRYLFFASKGSSVTLALRPLADSFHQTLSAKAEYRQTIHTLLATNLDLNKTATTLHIHRNTLIYRLSRFREETGLDPAHSLDDAIMCKLLLE